MANTLAPGEPVPWFEAPTLNGNPRFAFETAAGRWIMMLFMGSGADPRAQAALGILQQRRTLFDDRRTAFFGVTINPSDAGQGRIARDLPGIRWFLDYDRAVSIRYGAVTAERDNIYAAHWLLLDPMLRVHSRAALPDGEAIMAELQRVLDETTAPPAAPVLVVPGVLPVDMCRHLIGLYEEHGGEDSGFMREENGITVVKVDHGHKRRADHHIEDQRLIASLRMRIGSTLSPMIQRAFQFEATRVERFLVACYDAEEGGHFRAHRDNTTKGTAHRKFACTINLNAEDYEGGDLRFPEFGPRIYRAPTGGAVVFSCSLLHEAQPVTKGRRYAFLPFLYDEEGARIRERNLAHVAPELQNYRSGLSPEEMA